MLRCLGYRVATQALGLCDAYFNWDERLKERIKVVEAKTDKVLRMA